MKSNREQYLTGAWHDAIRDRDEEIESTLGCPCAAHRSASNHLTESDAELLDRIEKEMAKIERTTLDCLWAAMNGSGALIVANVEGWTAQEAKRLALCYQETLGLELLETIKTYRADTGWKYAPKARVPGNSLRGEWTYHHEPTGSTLTIPDHDTNEEEQS